MDFDELYEDTCSSVTVLARLGNLPALKGAVSRGEATNGTDNRGWRPLHHAVFQGHTNCVAILLTADDVEVNVQAFEGTTALMLTAGITCFTKAVDIARLLFSAGADPNMKDDVPHPWCVPLNMCIKSGNLDLVEEMLDNGADSNWGDDCDGPPLHLAAYMGNLEIMELLFYDGADILNNGTQKSTIFHNVMQTHQSMECLNFILTHTKDSPLINARGEDGATPLIMACQAKWEEAVHLLLDNGADPNLHSTGDRKILPVHLAIQYTDYYESDTHETIIERLLKITDKKLLLTSDCKPYEDISIYHQAILWKKYDVVRLLVAHNLPPDMYLQDTSGAIIDTEEKDSRTPLILPIDVTEDTPLSYLLYNPITQQSVDMAKHLIEEGGCSVNPVHSKCAHPLVEAVKHRQDTYNEGSLGFQLVQLLLNHGADVMYYSSNLEEGLPSALYAASLFNPRALFLLLRICKIRIKELFQHKTFLQISKFYIKHKLFETYADFDVMVITWLKILNIFISSISPHVVDLFRPDPPINEAHNNHWVSLHNELCEPKSLVHLCIIATREHLGQQCGFSGAGITQIIDKFHGNSEINLPVRIIELLHFQHINLPELIIHSKIAFNLKIAHSDDSDNNSVSD